MSIDHFVKHIIENQQYPFTVEKIRSELLLFFKKKSKDTKSMIRLIVDTVIDDYIDRGVIKKNEDDTYTLTGGK